MAADYFSVFGGCRHDRVEKTPPTHFVEGESICSVAVNVSKKYSLNFYLINRKRHMYTYAS